MIFSSRNLAAAPLQRHDSIEPAQRVLDGARDGEKRKYERQDRWMRCQKYASAMVMDRTEADGVCVPIALAWKDRRAAAITIVWASLAEGNHPR